LIKRLQSLATVTPHPPVSDHHEHVASEIHVRDHSLPGLERWRRALRGELGPLDLARIVGPDGTAEERSLAIWHPSHLDGEVTPRRPGLFHPVPALGEVSQVFEDGLIYGPSGCGKSSLVKAGLLPRLAANVRCVYVESSQEETETRLLRELRKHCPEADADLGLKDTVAALRRGQAIPAGTQVLIILDQFEQWLHAKREQQNTELVQALRQCERSDQRDRLAQSAPWRPVRRFLSRPFPPHQPA
jgi:hypothetical protein